MLVTSSLAHADALNSADQQMIITCDAAGEDSIAQNMLSVGDYIQAHRPSMSAEEYESLLKEQLVAVQNTTATCQAELSVQEK